MQKVLLEITIISCFLAFPSFSGEFSSKAFGPEAGDCAPWRMEGDKCGFDCGHSEQEYKIPMARATSDQNKVNQSDYDYSDKFVSKKTDIQIVIDLERSKSVLSSDDEEDYPDKSAGKAKSFREYRRKCKHPNDEEHPYSIPGKSAPRRVKCPKYSASNKGLHPDSESEDSSSAMSVSPSVTIYEGEDCCLGFEEKMTPSQVPPDLKHIAIIFDGSRRWAKERGLSSSQGHKAFIEQIPDIAADVFALKIPELTVWVLSTGNMEQRGAEEITPGMIYFEDLFDSLLALAPQLNMKIAHMGRKDRVPVSLRDKIIKAEQETSENTGPKLSVALDYGGENEIDRAIEKCDGPITVAKIMANLDNASSPDLIFRTTKNDLRTSGFMPLQIQYSELYITGSYAPDFRKYKCLEAGIRDYSKNRRRMFSK